MDQPDPDDVRLIKWREVMQTQVHEGPYLPRSQRSDLLIRLRVAVQAAAFTIRRDRHPSFYYNFDMEPIIACESKVWINFHTEEKRLQSVRDVAEGLALLGVEEKDWTDFAVEILTKAEPDIPLPQLAIDVTVRFMSCELYGSFDGYDDMRLSLDVKKSWDEYRAAGSHMHPSSSSSSSCAVCLEDFGGVEDKMIARLPCLHYFHAACTAHWVSRRLTCPVCRCRMIQLVCDESETFNPVPEPS